MSLFFIRSLDCGLQVPKIIQAVKNTDNIDSVRNKNDDRADDADRR